MKRGLMSFVLLLPLLAAAAPVDTGDVVNAINALGLDLYRAQSVGDGNLLFSPYSIQDALAMTYAGAAGDTRAEMQRVLHYPADDTALHGGFAELAKELAQIQQDSARIVAGFKPAAPANPTIPVDPNQPVPETDEGPPGRHPSTPVELHVANRLFVQNGYPLRAPFLALVKDNYGAEPEPLDFIKATEEARSTINDWVEKQTKEKIRDLIPPGGVTATTRLALANAIYLHAGWDEPFDKDWTKPAEFFVHGAESEMVPTMSNEEHDYGYLHRDGFTAVTLRYVGSGIQFLILLPDAHDGLPALEHKLTPELLAECAALPPSFVDLYLPKFKLEPPSMALGDQLKQLGLKTAFDIPKRSANFDRMAPRKPDDYLAISDVFHKAFLSLDEEGTEAAAATVVVMMEAAGAMMDENRPQPIEVHVDHPFIFAIQHVPSGACLFLGRVMDPR
ncbi:MAG TPA: serpin family protein [Opitutaceae bacterium]|jgi:serpin B|nr:serpin family protein [Opitutaceae bacterium]